MLKLSICDLSPLEIKQPFLLRAESLLEVESQRSRGSDSSGKKPLVRSIGDWSALAPLAPPMLPQLLLLLGDSIILWMGLWLWLTFTEVIIWLMSNCRWKQRNKADETLKSTSFSERYLKNYEYLRYCT